MGALLLGGKTRAELTAASTKDQTASTPSRIHIVRLRQPVEPAAAEQLPEQLPELAELTTAAG